MQKLKIYKKPYGIKKIMNWLRFLLLFSDSFYKMLVLKAFYYSLRFVW